jgi:hypothetical protein
LHIFVQIVKGRKFISKKFKKTIQNHENYIICKTFFQKPGGVKTAVGSEMSLVSGTYHENFGSVVMEMASFCLKIRHVFGDTLLTERSIGAGPPVIIQLSGSTPSEIIGIFLTPRKFSSTGSAPSEVFVLQHPSEIFNLAPPQKFRISDPFGKSRQQGGVDIKWNGPLPNSRRRSSA